MTKLDPKRSKYKGPFSMDNREWGSHALGVYPKQDTLSMGTARVKQEEETKILRESSKKSGKRNVGTKSKSPKQDLTIAKDLTIQLPER